MSRQLTYIHERGMYSMVLFVVRCTVFDWTTSVIFTVSDRVTNANANRRLKMLLLFLCLYTFCQTEREIIPLEYQSFSFYKACLLLMARKERLCFWLSKECCSDSDFRKGSISSNSIVLFTLFQFEEKKRNYSVRLAIIFCPKSLKNCIS